MKRITIAAAIAALLVTLPVAAETETFTLDPNHTFPAFEVDHFGYSTQRGRFNKSAGKITLDSAARKGSAEIAIETASISTGNPKLEEHLRSPDFFDAAAFPQMTFKSNDFAFDGERVRSASGDLTLRGITRPVALKAERFICGVHPMLKKKVCGAEFTATIKRSEFGIKAYLPGLGDEVLLRINVEAIKD